MFTEFTNPLTAQIKVILEENPNLIIMQFTNAYDTGSKEMYADDIVMVDGLGKCTVKLCAYYGVVFVDSKGQECAMIDSMAENDSFYVIGNIFENKELLKSVK